MTRVLGVLGYVVQSGPDNGHHGRGAIYAGRLFQLGDQRQGEQEGADIVDGQGALGIIDNLELEGANTCEVDNDIQTGQAVRTPNEVLYGCGRLEVEFPYLDYVGLASTHGLDLLFHR